MIQGAKLKTKTGPDNNRDEFFFVYDRPGGTKIGAVKEGIVIGTYDRTESKLLTPYAYVRLTEPVTYNGSSYRYVYIRESAVYEYAPSLTTYYVKPTTSRVNVRSSPTSASSKNVIGSLTANQLVGTTDGTTQNGFFQFSLAKGGTGWVSRNYITSTVPAGKTAPVSDPTAPADVVTDPATDSLLAQSGTEVENSLGSTGLLVLKWVGVALLALALGIGVAKWSTRKRSAR
ncbi:hypothetical protein GCM10027578_22230 [Spirosoma luteolum]